MTPRRTIATALAAILLLAATAPVTAAASPDRYVERGSWSGIDGSWSDACGTDIDLTETWRATYLTWGNRYEIHWQALRTLEGPAGSLLVRNNYSFGGPFGTVVEDPEAGTVTETGSTTTTGARVFVSPSTGVVISDTGLYHEESTAVYGPGDEFELTIHESYARGNDNEIGGDAFTALVCGALVG